MAIPVARVHLKVAHGALPALLPTPPKWKMLPPLLPKTTCAATTLPKPLAKPSRADADERWDAHKTKPASAASSASSSSSSSGTRSAGSIVGSIAGHGFSRKNVTSPSPTPKPGRADSVESWNAHKKAASTKWPISRASSAERWDVHKKRRSMQAEPLDDDDESSCLGSNDVDTEEEEILWKPQAMYAGPGFAVATPESSMLPMPTAFLVPVA